MAATQNPALLRQLYGMAWDRNLQGYYGDQKTLQGKRNTTSSEAMSGYENLMGGDITPISTPVNTLRNVSRPTLSSPSSGVTMGSGAGGTGGDLPVYDFGKVESLTQRAAAPGVRRLRTAMQETQQGYYENPNVKRMTIRDALAGYGQGLEDVMGGAYKTGASIYGQEYGLKGQEALQSQRIAAEERMQSRSLSAQQQMNKYNNEWREYLASLGR